MPISEQRDIENTESNLNSPSGSGQDFAATASTASQELKPSVTGLRPDPAQLADSRSRAIPDGGPGQTLKHTDESFEEEADKLAKDLQGKCTFRSIKGISTDIKCFCRSQYGRQ